MPGQASKNLHTIESPLSSVMRRVYSLLVRPMLRNLPRGLRGLLIRELSANMSPADRDRLLLHDRRPEGTVLPVLPSSPADDLYLAYVKAFLVVSASGRQVRDSRP
jgi:hypothetical protein